MWRIGRGRYASIWRIPKVHRSTTYSKIHQSSELELQNLQQNFKSILKRQFCKISNNIIWTPSSRKNKDYKCLYFILSIR